MKVLYAIQTTGNGHISRAKEIIPYLDRRFQYDILLSGPKNHLDLGYPVKYHLRGLTLHYNKSGGIHWLKTFLKNNLFYFIRDVFSLRVQDYDLIITDFEPISAWACKLRGVLSLGLSNQISLWQKKVPKPKEQSSISLKYMKKFAPTNLEYGFHYQKFNKRIFFPIIRTKLREMNVSIGGGILVYLPAYDLNNIVEVLSLFPKVKWNVFSKEIKNETIHGSIKTSPISEDHFLKELAQCDGVITNAGFATTSEALFLGKPLLTIPMRGQIEQSYNAFALKKMGVTVLKKFSVDKVAKIENWLENPKVIHANFENDLNYLVDQIALDYIKSQYTDKIIYT